MTGKGIEELKYAMAEKVEEISRSLVDASPAARITGTLGEIFNQLPIPGSQFSDKNMRRPLVGRPLSACQGGSFVTADGRRAHYASGIIDPCWKRYCRIFAARAGCMVGCSAFMLRTISPRQTTSAADNPAISAGSTR